MVEALTPGQRSSLTVDLGFLPEPVPLVTVWPERWGGEQVATSAVQHLVPKHAQQGRLPCPASPLDQDHAPEPIGGVAERGVQVDQRSGQLQHPGFGIPRYWPFECDMERWASK
jgi:hypothetical protein